VPITAWSFSRYSRYQHCPLQFKLQYIDKVGKQESAAMAAGDKVHKETEAYITGKWNQIPAAVKYPQHKQLLDEVRAFDDKVVEQEWGFNSRWEPCGWFGKATWFRQKLDAAVLYEDMTVEGIDWKTGKKYPDSLEQIELQALSIFRHFKPAKHVSMRLTYFDSGEDVYGEFPKADEEALMRKWEDKARPMFTDTQFLPRPNDRCRFCDFAASKGSGKCRFG
jgi:hypothetical protein